ncbi:MAG: CofH family radical SAM protein [Saprospiraceae bacterium]|nr:CofH family radical SAM protein [Saprospiraceae bacterium]
MAEFDSFIRRMVEEEKNVSLQNIGWKVLESERILPSEGIQLYEEASLSYLGSLANLVASRMHRGKVYFNRNFHIEPTNVCIYSCSFCSYSRLIKKRSDGWEYTMDQMMEIVRSYDGKPVTEVHIVGGVLPQYDLKFYTEFFKKIKSHRPELHIKALTPVEYHYIFKKAGVSYEEGMRLIKESGVDSLPGGGAEIFDEQIRDEIAGGKCSSEEWLRIHRIWHDLGMKSNATILYGHIESYAHRIDHMERLRQLQDQTGGFQTFIPLKFRNKDNQMSHIAEGSLGEDLKNYAVSRIYLDNFPHLKSYWPMLGRQFAQLSMSFGVNDVDGTIDDSTKIYSMAGSEEQSPSMTTQELVSLIKLAGKIPIERDTLYYVVQDYSEVEFVDNPIRSYVELPLTN